MKPTPPKKRMTAKERVLAVYPFATHWKGWVTAHAFGIGAMKLGYGKTIDKAWAAAARSLP